ncbi:YbaB/EbfC family nucleoid-associated protein [bacterium]|nr:YbaB/EbfC family nucleoid-associated protein [bacterium]
MKGLDMKSLMKEAEKMQKQFEKQQAELENVTVEGSSGGGAVTVVATGNAKIKSIHIEKDVVNPDDVTMLEDLVLSAVNNALHKAEDMANQEMNKVTGGILPGMKLK